MLVGSYGIPEHGNWKNEREGGETKTKNGQQNGRKGNKLPRGRVFEGKSGERKIELGSMT